MVVDGAVESIDDYGPAPGELWRVLADQYGVTRASVSAAIANGRVVAREPAASTAGVH